MTTQELEKGFKEIWALFKATDKKIVRVSDQIAGLTGKWGLFIEGLVIPAVERLFKERNIEVERVSQRVRARKNGREMEVDILALNDQYAVLIEAKSTLGVQDVDEHLQRLADFKTFYPEYKERKTVGAVAGIVIEEGVDRYAYMKGLFVIAQSGDTVKILNDRRFKPRFW
ncbi:MAG: DUF3782 domain-containing protein [bacterium]